MTESQMWKTFRDKIARFGDMERVENLINKGTPDVHACVRGREFWLELKMIKEWPKRDSSPVRIPHFKREQRLWIRKRGMVGGKVYVLLLVAETNTWMLFDWEFAWGRLGEEPREVLFREALTVGLRGLDVRGFLTAIGAPSGKSDV